MDVWCLQCQIGWSMIPLAHPKPVAVLDQTHGNHQKTAVLIFLDHYANCPQCLNPRGFSLSVVYVSIVVDSAGCSVLAAGAICAIYVCMRIEADQVSSSVHRRSNSGSINLLRYPRLVHRATVQSLTRLMTTTKQYDFVCLQYAAQDRWDLVQVRFTDPIRKKDTCPA